MNAGKNVREDECKGCNYNYENDISTKFFYLLLTSMTCHLFFYLNFFFFEKLSHVWETRGKEAKGFGGENHPKFKSLA